MTTLPSFPGAEGAGAKATGGRGGRVIEVTTLEDSGPGSLRSALDATGPRIVVFRVAGTIELKSRLNIKSGDVTIAGQSAPGEGICLKNYGLNVSANNVVIRYLRTRLGDESAQQSDAFTIARRASQVIVDHCTSTWSIDEALSLAGDNTDVTVQWCIIAEALRQSKHAKGAHGFGSLVRATGQISLHHNLWAHNDSRNPRLGDTYGNGQPTFDVRNNVIYDFGHTATGSTQGKLKINYIGNYIRSGPSSTAKNPIKIGGPSEIYLYLTGNVFEGNEALSTDNSKFPDKTEIDGKQQVQIVGEAFEMPPVHTTSATDAYEAVLAHAGASLPARDSADTRIIQAVRERGGRMIDSQTEVGGWPALKVAPALEDTDHDGMPDTWEKQYGFNPADANDGSLDMDKDGYTNVEESLNGTNPKEFVDYLEFKNNVDPRTAAKKMSNSSSDVRPFKVHRDVEYRQVDGRTLFIDVYVPEGAGPFPAVLTLHGGGWSSGSKDGDIMPAIETLAPAGFVCFSPQYRLAPENRWPACYEDVEAALGWVKANAAAYKADPNRLAILGYSAGGHLACRAGVLASKANTVQAIVGLAAPTDIVADMARRGELSPSMKNLTASEVLDDALNKRLFAMSPINDIRPGLPPVLFIHGTEDQSVPFNQSVAFRKRLQEVGVPCEIIELPGAGHRIRDWPQADPKYKEKMVAWLTRKLG